MVEKMSLQMKQYKVYFGCDEHEMSGILMTEQEKEDIKLFFREMKE